MPPARLSGQFDPNLLWRHIPWLAVQECSKTMLYIMQRCQAFLHDPNKSKDWLVNLNCFSIKKHKTVLVLYHLTKLHPIRVQQGQGSPTLVPTDAFSLPISFFHFSHQLICGELPSHHHDQVLDDIFRTIDIKKPSNHCWYTARIHLE